MILVTGGTGMVGAHLLLHLTQNGHRVRATHRKQSNLKRVEEIFGYFAHNASQLFESIDWVEADITDLPKLENAFEGITQVFHCAAFISFRAKDYQLLKSINIRGTANVVNLCLTNNIEHVCHVSSVAALGSTLDDRPIHEEIHWNPEENNNVYAISKYGAEMHVWRGIQEGLNAVIVCPGIILGEGNWNSGSGRIFTKASKGMKFYTSGGSGFIDVKDVVESMILLANKRITNERYILVAHNATYRKLLTLLSQGFSLPEPKKYLSKRALTWLGYLDGLFSFILRKSRRLNKNSVESLSTITTYSSEKIRNELNISFIPLEETIKRVCKNYSSKS
ncbi:MAG: NAD-dependent epimerase/dehydratase family protein [Aureisphaera sp.]